MRAFLWFQNLCKLCRKGAIKEWIKVWSTRKKLTSKVSPCFPNQAIRRMKNLVFKISSSLAKSPSFSTKSKLKIESLWRWTYSTIQWIYLFIFVQRESIKIKHACPVNELIASPSPIFPTILSVLLLFRISLLIDVNCWPTLMVSGV